MEMQQIKDLFSAPLDTPQMAQGWIRSVRRSKNAIFVALNDGSCFNSLQLVLTPNLDSPSLTTGASVKAQGLLSASQGSGQDRELRAEKITLLGEADSEFPLQKKHHTFEYLRTISHLRARSNTFSAVFRVRSALSFAIHEFLTQENFFYIHTPVITTNDGEGAGEMFELEGSEDFFGSPAYLTVSGQLQAEALAQALSRVYTFGPTFRAENSNTSRHLSEFWMVEPEIAFCTLEPLIDFIERFVKSVVSAVRERRADDLEFFNSWIHKSLLEELDNIISKPFARVTYTEAVEQILKGAPDSIKGNLKWGDDLGSEREQFLCTDIYHSPVAVYNYPQGIKAFYMKGNDDRKTVAGVDVLFPRLGEVVGGSERESDLDKLSARMKEMGVARGGQLEWYKELRRWGTVPHSGFGIGFERLLMLVTGIANIRDSIPFPRAPKLCYF